MRKILEEVHPKGKDIEVLPEDEEQMVSTEWLDRKLETIWSGSVHSLFIYLWTKSIHKFVTKQRVRTDEVPSLGPEAITIVKNIKELLISAWRKMSGINTCPQTTENILKTCDHRLTNEDLEDFS